MKRDAIYLLGETGAWAAMFYALPVMFYFVVLLPEPPLVASPSAGLVVPLNFDGLFVIRWLFSRRL